MVADALQVAVETSKTSEMDRGKSTEGSLATRCDRAAAALQSGSPSCAVSVRQLIFLLNRESDGSLFRQRRRGQTEPRTGNQPPIPGDHLTLAAQYYERTRSVFDQVHGPA